MRTLTVIIILGLSAALWAAALRFKEMSEWVKE